MQSKSISQNFMFEQGQKYGRRLSNNLQGPSTVSCILQLDLYVKNTAIHLIQRLAADRAIHDRYVAELDACLAFSKKNLLSKCIEVQSRENLQPILSGYPEMQIMNTNNLFFKDSLLNLVREDNTLIDRLFIDQHDKLIALFGLYLDRSDLKRLIPVLNLENIDKLLAVNAIEPENVKKIYNNLEVSQLCTYIENNSDDEVTIETLFELLDLGKIAQVFSKLPMQPFLDRMSLEKVLKLYFHYRNTGSISKMAEILQDYNQDKLYTLLNKFKKMKNGIDSLIESFQ